MIEKFAASSSVPFEPWHRSKFDALGFLLKDEKLTEDGHAKFIEASAPGGWTRRLDKSGDWRFDLVDPDGRVRVTMTYKLWDYSYATFLCRYSIETCNPFCQSASAVRMRIYDLQTHSSIRYSLTYDDGNYYDSRKQAEKSLEDFMLANFPNSQLPAPIGVWNNKVQPPSCI